MDFNNNKGREHAIVHSTNNNHRKGMAFVRAVLALFDNNKCREHSTYDSHREGLALALAAFAL